MAGSLNSHEEAPTDNFLTSFILNFLNSITSRRKPPLPLAMADDIPLHCLVCSRNFSDVSHLLTHIASKAHLSAYYKLKVTVSTNCNPNPADKKLLDDFDDWYTDYNVENIMLERMIAKNKKKNGIPTNQHNNSTTANSSRATSTHLDPQLGPTIKTESKSRSATPLDMAVHDRFFAPQMQNWPVTPCAHSPMSRETSALTSLYTATPSSDTEATTSPLPTIKRRPKQAINGGPHSTIQPEDGPANNDATVKKPKDSNKLKGVVWDGMDWFDAATPETRRRRNQKKAISVIQHLQTTSEVVEATEMVFDAEGELRRQREITGNPDIDDPLKGESSPEPDTRPKKRSKTTRPHKTLAKKNVNTGRATRGRGKNQIPQSTNTRHNTPYFTNDQADNDALTYGQFHRSNRQANLNMHQHHTMNIHRDRNTPQIVFRDPNPMRMLTSGMQNPLVFPGSAIQFPPSNMSTFGQLTQNPYTYHHQQSQQSFGMMAPLHHQQQPFDFFDPNPLVWDDDATVSPPSER